MTIDMYGALATKAACGVCGSDLSRHQPVRSARADFPGRTGFKLFWRHREKRAGTQTLGERGWLMKELNQRRKGDNVKVKMANQMREEATMTWPWIAQKLNMGHCRTAANAVRALAQG